MNQMRNVRTILDRFLERYGKPPIKDMEAASQRAWRSVLAGEIPRLEEPSGMRDSKPARSSWIARWPAVATLVAAVVIAVLVPAKVLRSAPAVLEDSAGFRNVQYGELVRSSGSGTLKFSDGARVEMRAESEVSFERSGDDMRVRVRRGDVIVNATKRSTGQLSVETRDMSAVGKVLLVNTKDEGTRVAVIVGEARVQQGATLTRLLPGEHVATSPKMELLSLKKEGGWSPQAEAQMALLQTAVAQKTQDPRLAFEVASIRPHPAASTDGRGAGGSNLIIQGPAEGCAAVDARIDPRRFAVDDLTAWNLIMWAAGAGFSFDNNCIGRAVQNLVSGGPGWIKSDKWDVETVIPENQKLAVRQRIQYGAPVPVLDEVDTVKLQKMILSLLEDRFKLVLRRESKEVPAYALTLEKGTSPKLTVASFPQSSFGTGMDDPKFTRLWNSAESGATGGEGASLWGKDVFVRDLIPLLSRVVTSPVMDRTDFAGKFSFVLLFNPPNRNNPGWADRPSIFNAIEKQVGFKLESTKTVVETWTIESIQKPSEN
jgi:uncharacterized protein (TIGR03435 family)